MLDRAVRWSLGRPRLVALAALWLLIVGGLYVRDLKIDLLPARQVEQQIERPLEAVEPHQHGVVAVGLRVGGAIVQSRVWRRGRHRVPPSRTG